MYYIYGIFGPSLLIVYQLYDSTTSTLSLELSRIPLAQNVLSGHELNLETAMMPLIIVG